MLSILILMKKKICSIIILVLCGIIYYLFFTRDGSIKIGLLLSGYNPFVSYENIDYDNDVSYLNPIEINGEIIYLECKNYGVIKVSKYYDFESE